MVTAWLGWWEGLARLSSIAASGRLASHGRQGWLPVTLVTSDRFGRIAASLRRQGRPLPTHDIWIAAHAMESGAELLSFDRHFEQVDGIAWVQPEE